jgi:hypothetical protein
VAGSAPAISPLRHPARPEGVEDGRRSRDRVESRSLLDRAAERRPGGPARESVERPKAPQALDRGRPEATPALPGQPPGAPSQGSPDGRPHADEVPTRDHRPAEMRERMERRDSTGTTRQVEPRSPDAPQPQPVPQLKTPGATPPAMDNARRQSRAAEVRERLEQREPPTPLERATRDGRKPDSGPNAAPRTPDRQQRAIPQPHQKEEGRPNPSARPPEAPAPIRRAEPPRREIQSESGAQSQGTAAEKLLEKRRGGNRGPGGGDRDPRIRPNQDPGGSN